MELRQLGRSPLRVSALCLGGNVPGWTTDERTSFSLLDAWLDGGFNFIDTADVYSRWAPGHQGGESETVIGRWLKQGGRRDKVAIAWTMAQPGITAPIASATSLAQLRELVQASELALDSETLALLAQASDEI